MPFFGSKKKEEKHAAPPHHASYAPPPATTATPEPTPAAPSGGDDIFGGMAVTTTTRTRRKKKAEAVEETASAASSEATTGKGEAKPAGAGSAEKEPTNDVSPETKQESVDPEADWAPEAKPFRAPKLSFGGEEENFDFQVEDPSVARIRERLERFYEAYNPSKLSVLDTTLKVYAGKEEQLFEALVKKYGPEPGHGRPVRAASPHDVEIASSTHGHEEEKPAETAPATASGGDAWGTGAATDSTGGGWGDAPADTAGGGWGDTGASEGATGWGDTANGGGGFSSEGFGDATATAGGDWGTTETKDDTAGNGGGFGFGDAPAEGDSAAAAGFAFDGDAATANGDSAPKESADGGVFGFGEGTAGGTEAVDAFSDAVAADSAPTQQHHDTASETSSEEEDVPLYEQHQRELKSAISYLAETREEVASVVKELARCVAERQSLVKKLTAMEQEVEQAVANEDYENAERLDEAMKSITQEIVHFDTKCTQLPQQLTTRQKDVETALTDLAYLSEQHGISLKAVIGDEERRVDRYITENTVKLEQVADRVAAELERSTRNMNNIEQEVVNLQHRRKKVEDKINSDTEGLRKERDTLALSKKTVEEEIRELEAQLANKRRALAEWKLALGDVEEKLRIIMCDHESTLASVETQMQEEDEKLTRARKTVDGLTVDEEKARRDKANLEDESSKLLKQLEVQKVRIAHSSDYAARIRGEGIERARQFFETAYEVLVEKRNNGKAFLCKGAASESSEASSILPALTNINNQLTVVEGNLQTEAAKQSVAALRLQDIAKSLPLLEAAKKAAAAAKQFRDAGQKTAEIKALTDEKTSIEGELSASQHLVTALKEQQEVLRTQRVEEEKNASKVIAAYMAEYNGALLNAAAKAEEGSGLCEWIRLMCDDDDEDAIEGGADSAQSADPLSEAATALVRAFRSEAAQVESGCSSPTNPTKEEAVATPPAPAPPAPAAPSRPREEIEAEIAKLEEEVEAAAEAEDYEQADALQGLVDKLKAELEAAA